MTKVSPEIAAYIAGFPQEVRNILEIVHHTVATAAPEAQETIKYNMPTFVNNKGNLVHFAAFKAHIGFYPAPTNDARFNESLAPFKTGKGSVQFPYNKPMPLELITRIVKWRLAKNG